jgi:hypothetical protein
MHEPPQNAKNVQYKKLLLTVEQAKKAQRGRKGIALLFNFGAAWGWVVNAMPLPLYPQERAGTHSI